jgi:hypothetical protein
MTRHAIFLNGPIGSGKTTLGRRLAVALGGGFVDGDDCADHSKPWFANILTTSRNIVSAGFAALETRSTVVIAYPLGCSSWIYYRRKFGDAGVPPVFVTLRASYETITASGRGRVFDAWEHARIKTMLREGYDSRLFSDLIFDTDKAGFEETLGRLTDAVQVLIAKGS